MAQVPESRKSFSEELVDKTSVPRQNNTIRTLHSERGAKLKWEDNFPYSCKSNMVDIPGKDTDFSIDLKLKGKTSPRDITTLSIT